MKTLVVLFLLIGGSVEAAVRVNPLRESVVKPCLERFGIRVETDLTAGILPAYELLRCELTPGEYRGVITELTGRVRNRRTRPMFDSMMQFRGWAELLNQKAGECGTIRLASFSIDGLNEWLGETGCP